jgi:hypothetical protein
MRFAFPTFMIAFAVHPVFMDEELIIFLNRIILHFS